METRDTFLRYLQYEAESYNGLVTTAPKSLIIAQRFTTEPLSHP